MRAPSRATAASDNAAAARTPRQTQTTGILLLLASVFLFTLMDATGKHLTGSYHPAQIIWARMALNLVIVLVIFAPRLGRVIRSRSPALQVGRGLTQLGSIACFFTAIQFIGLAEATAIMDINPVLITLGAALFLGERIGLRRIMGIAVALAGALIIIRPGAGVLHPAAVLPLIGAFSYAAGAVMTRMVRGDSTATSILWSTGVATIGASLVAPFVWQPIQPGDLWAFAAMGLLGTVAQALLTRAHVGGEPVLALAPCATLPAQQRRGAGSAAIRAALEAAREQGENLVVVLGHAEYYPRFGFTPASGVGVTAPFDVPDEAFLALALDPERPTPRGQIAYPPAFGV